MKTCVQILAALLGLALGANSLHAASTYMWIAQGGVWSTAANWSGGAIADGAGNYANFNMDITANRTVTLDSNRTIGTVIWGDTAGNSLWTVSGSGVLTMDNTGGGATPPLIRGVQDAVTVNIVIAGTAGIRTPYAGAPAAVLLNAANLYTGNTEVSRNILRIGNVNALPSFTGNGRTGDVVFRQDSSAQATLDLNGISITINGLTSDVGTAGLGTVTTAKSGAITFTVGDNNATTTFAGVIQNGSGSIALTKIGTGTLTLSGVNTYTPATTISAGTLALSGSGSIANSSTISLGGSGTFDVSGVTSSPYTIASGKTLNGSAGTGTINGSLTLASGALLTLNYATGTPTMTVPSGTLTLNANATAVTCASLLTTAGSPYKLISKSGSGSVAGTTGTLTLLGGGVGDGGTPSLAITGGELFLNIVGGGPILEWGPADGTWAVGTAGWGSGGLGTWADGDAAQLTDTYSTGSPTITLSTEVKPTVLLMSSTKTWTISGAGDIGGSAAVRMIGPGTLTLDAPNAYTGGTELTGGTLNIKQASALGASGTLTINSGTLDNTSAGLLTTPNYAQAWNGNFAFGGTADLDLGTGAVTMSATRTVTVNGTKTLTVGGAISGTGFGLIKAGTGSLALGGNNAFTGGVTINLGEIIANNPGALNSTTPNTVTFAADANTKTLSLNGNSLQVNNLSGGSTAGYAVTTVRNNHASTPATLTISVASGTSTFIGTVADGGAAPLAVTKIGSGVWAFGGGGTAGSGTYSGDTTITAGTLRVASNALLPSGAGKGNVINNATLDMYDRNVSINGLNGSGTVTTTANSINNALTVGNGNASGSFSGVINNGSTTAVSLTKVGSGEQKLSGVNTYAGATTVAVGRLTGVTGGSCANSAISVLGTGTLNVQYSGSNAKWRASSLTFTAAGANLNFDLGANPPSVTTAPLELINGVTFTATPTVNIDGASPIANGAYPLIKYTTAFSGTMPITATLPAGSGSATLVDDSTTKTIWLWVGGLPIHWATGDGAWDLFTFNWFDASSTPTAYADGVPVAFLDADSIGSPTVTLGIPVQPTAVLVSANTKDYTLTGVGAINGSAILNKSGAGALTLDLANGYTGGSVLYGGTLKLKQASALGGIAGTFTINGGTLDNALGSPLALNSYPQAWNGDFSFAGSSDLDLGAGAVTLSGTRTVTVTASKLTVGGAISGTGFGLIKAGAGTLALGGNNAFTGGATINLGEVVVNNPGALNSTAPNVVKFALDTNIKTLSLNGNSLTVANLQGGQAVAAYANTQIRNNHASTPVTLTVSVPSGTSQFMGLIADGSGALTGGTLAVTKIGSGVWMFGGGSAFSSGTYSGDTTISAGTLRVGGSSLFPSGAGKGNVIVNATLDIYDRSVIINGLNGTGTVTGTANAGGANVNVGNGDASGSFSGVINNGSTTISLTKSGLGTQRLSGTLAYTGATTVNGGALVVNSPGSTASGSAVTVAANATLGGSGTIKGTTTVAASGILAPGVDAAAAGTTLAVSATTLTLNSACIISNRINKVGATLTADKVNKTGNLTLAGTLKVVLDTGASPLALGDTFDLFDGTIVANTLTYNLPSLPVGLTWDTSQLNAGGNGTIKVACDGTLAAHAGANQSLCYLGSAIIGGSPTATGGSGGYSYSWSPGTGLDSATIANPTASPTTTTTYTVTVTDSVGCTAMSSVTITAGAATAISTQPANQTACSGSTATFSVTASGPGTLGYSWSKNDNTGWGSPWAVSGSGGTFRASSTGNNFGGPTCSSFSSALDINSPSGNAMGMWGGASGTTVATRTFAALAVGQTVNVDFDNGNVDTGKEVGFSLETSGGADVLQFYFLGGDSNYTYNDGSAHDTLIPFQRTGLRVQFALTSASTYTLIVTPCGGTSTSFNGSYSGTIAQLKLFNQNTSGGGDYDVYFNNFIVGGYTDNADNYAGDYAGLDKGNQPITGANGSTYTTPVLAVGDSGTQYQVVVNSGCGCAVLSSAATVTVNALPVISSVTPLAVTCNGGSDGSITIVATGAPALTYSIDNGGSFQASGSFAGLAAGSTYNVVVKDGNGCAASYSGNPVSVTQPAVVAVTENTGARVNVTCNTGSDGQIVLNAATGGSGAGYQYSKDGGANWQASTTFSGLAANTYQMKAKDGNGCLSANVPVTITQPAAPARPLIESVTFVSPDVVLVWSSAVGQKYRVEYTTALPSPPAAATWTALTPDVTAGGATATYTDTAPPAPRYYRVVTVCP